MRWKIYKLLPGRKMPFLFPRRCIRTRLEFLAKKSRTWRRRDRLVAGKHLQLTYARKEHVRLLRFSSPRRDASSICVRRASFGANLRPPVSFETAAAKQLETATRFHPRTSWSFQLRLSPLLPPPLRRIRPSRRERDRRGKGENGFATVFSEKIVFRKIK